MKTIFTLVIALSISVISQAQSIEKFSIDSGGTLAVSNDLEMLYTLGEVNVQELDEGSIMVSEGFINSGDFNTLNIVDIHDTKSDVIIYPNPTSEIINFKSVIPIDSLDIYNSLGKKVFSNTNVSVIDIKHLASGMYFLKLYQRGRLIYKKIIINSN